jgi:hypothetical protein
MKSLAKFFAYIWGLIEAAFSRITVIGASISTALLAVVTYVQSVISGLTSIAQTFQTFAEQVKQAVAPVQSAIQGNQWFMLLGYSMNLDTLLGVVSALVTALVSVFVLAVGLTVGFLILYSGFVVLSYVLRLLKGVTASFIDFN